MYFVETTKGKIYQVTHYFTPSIQIDKLSGVGVVSWAKSVKTPFTQDKEKFGFFAATTTTMTKLLKIPMIDVRQVWMEQ